MNLIEWKTYIGQRTREARESASLTVDQLNTLVRFPDGCIDRIERGEVSPSYFTRATIATAMGLPRDYFEDAEPRRTSFGMR